MFVGPNSNPEANLLLSRSCQFNGLRVHDLRFKQLLASSVRSAEFHAPVLQHVALHLLEVLLRSVLKPQGLEAPRMSLGQRHNKQHAFCCYNAYIYIYIYIYLFIYLL